MTAELSFQDKFAYYGLRVSPSYDQVLGTIKKKWNIPVPNRQEKWYMLGPYRSFILDAQKRYSNHEQMKLGYQDSGATLPEAAAAGTMPSEAGSDPSLMRHEDRNHEIDAYDLAKEAVRNEYQQQKQQTMNTRKQQLSSYGPNLIDPTVEAHHEDLVDADVPHAMPYPRPPMAKASWATAHQAYIDAGIPQAPEFPTYEALNYGQSQIHKPAKLSTDVGKTYETIRDYALGR